MSNVFASLIVLFITSALLPLSAAASEEYLTISAVGDIMMGTNRPAEILPPYDGFGMFDNIKEHFRESDIVFGNLEGPMIDSGKAGKCAKGLSRLCFEFAMPTRYALHLKDAGFTVLNIANNHSFDFGLAGMQSTIAALDALGINSIGGERIASLTIKRKKIALVGFSFSRPSEYSFSITDIGTAQKIVRDLKAAHDIVIVSFHGGAEGKRALSIPRTAEIFAGENRGDVIKFSRAVVDAGADLVLGHGPHVLRAIELYKKKLIVYSLGNFLTFGRFNIAEENGMSIILNITLDLTTGDLKSGRMVSMRLLNEGIPLIDYDHDAARLVKELTKRDIGRQTLLITADGTVSPLPISPPVIGELAP